MSKLILMVGLPFSGKTTRAKQLEKETDCVKQMILGYRDVLFLNGMLNCLDKMFILQNMIKGILL